jgi:hypothetical protein
MSSPTLTAGEIIAALSAVPADTPVIMVITDTDRACNVTGLEVEYDGNDGAADIAVLACADNYDPRQW